MSLFSNLRRRVRGNKVKIPKNLKARPVLPVPPSVKPRPHPPMPPSSLRAKSVPPRAHPPMPPSSLTVEKRMKKSQAELQKLAADQQVGMVRTEVGKGRLENHPDFSVRGGVEFFKNRKIIGRDVSVNKGIYVGAGPREAIVVDRKYGELNRLYEKAKKRATVDGKVNKNYVIKAVFDVVNEAMPVKDDAEVKKLRKKRNIGKDGEIPLDVFLREGVGVCRHNALATADLLQHFKEEGILTGKASVDRNTKTIVINGETKRPGHAWCRYTNSAGDVYLIDPMHGKLKKLSELDLRKWEHGGDWDYKRAGD